MYAVLGLPSLTVSCARGADLLGCFGLVAWPITILYHVSDLSLDLPRETFTNLYHRGPGTHTDSDS